MAEHKYDGLLYTTVTDKEIRQKPWYKERVREKFLKNTRQQELGKAVVADNWMFVKSGLDDCRTGVPPQKLNETPLMRRESGVQPMLVGEGRRGRLHTVRSNEAEASHRSDATSEMYSGRTSSAGSALDIKTAINRPLTDYEKRFSRKIPMQLRRLERVEAIEESIMQHKLTMFPHFEESVPTDMFDEIMQVLDPEVYAGDKLESLRSRNGLDSAMSSAAAAAAAAAAAPEPEPESRAQTAEDAERTRTQATNESADDDADKPGNPYRWIAKRLEQEIRPRRKQDESFEKPEPTHTLPFTNQFCEWVKDIGGSDPSNNIKEQTLIGLFESGYETKPALSVPVQIVELSNIPPELRAAAVQSAVPPKDGKDQSGSEQRRQKEWSRAQPPANPDQTVELVKFRYGAWYLPTELWKRSNANEPLRDPKEVQKEALSEVKKRNLQIDTELAPMHCTKSFLEFAQRKGGRNPQFLNSALDIQKQMEDEKHHKDLQLVKDAKRRSMHDTLFGSSGKGPSKSDFDAVLAASKTATSS